MISGVLLALVLCLWQATTNKNDKIKSRFGWVSVFLVWWLFVLTGALKLWMVEA